MSPRRRSTFSTCSPVTVEGLPISPNFLLGEEDSELLLTMQFADALVFETIIAKLYSALLRPGDVCVDGGANRGLHTGRLARCVGPTGQVIAVEPIPSLSKELAGMLEVSGLSNVRVVPS